MAAQVAPVAQLQPANQVVDLTVEEVNEKVSQVYKYTAALFAATFVSSGLFTISGLTAKVVTLMVSAGVWTTVIGLTAISVGLLTALHFTPKEQSALRYGLGGVFSVFQGLALSPLVLINSTVFAGAAAATVGIVGGLGYAATKIQVEFERYEKIMFVALAALAVVSLGGIFLTGAVGAVANQISLVGGFALFSAYVVYDVQQVRKSASSLTDAEFDPLHHTMNLYLDSINIFTKIFRALNKN